MVYANNIVIIEDEQEGITDLKQQSFQHFQTKDLGHLRDFLRTEVVEVVRSHTSIDISQRKYALYFQGFK